MGKEEIALKKPVAALIAFILISTCIVSASAETCSLCGKTATRTCKGTEDHRGAQHNCTMKTGCTTRMVYFGHLVRCPNYRESQYHLNTSSTHQHTYMHGKTDCPGYVSYSTIMTRCKLK